MKVNPVSIQSYQQIAQRDRAADRAKIAKADDQSLTIQPEKKSVSSSLAVRVPGASYADVLSPEENQALNLLFSKFRGNDQLGSGYQAGPAADETGVGRIIDLKV